MNKKRTLIQNELCLLLLVLLITLCGCQKAQTIELGETFEIPDTNTGKLLCTINGAELISSDSGVCLKQENFRGDSSLAMGDDSLNPGQFLDDQGYPIDGCCVITLDVSVHSDDATNTLYDEGDGHIFRADHIVWLVNCEEKKNGNYRPAYAPIYFSNLNGCSVHPMAYKIEPNETINFTIGFVVTEDWALKNLEQLRGSLGSSTDSPLLNLHFGR